MFNNKRSNQIIDDVVFLCEYDTVLNVAQNNGVNAQKNSGVHSVLNVVSSYKSFSQVFEPVQVCLFLTVEGLIQLEYVFVLSPDLHTDRQLHEHVYSVQICLGKSEHEIDGLARQSMDFSNC